MRAALVIALCGCGRISFDPLSGAACDDTASVIVPAASSPVALVAADLDSDGRSDLAAVSPSQGVLEYWIAGPRRTFESRGPLASGSSPRNITVGSLGGQGVPYIVTSNSLGGDISVFRVSGGVAEPAVHYAVGGMPTSVATVDLDRDNTVDIVVGAGQSPNLSWLKTDYFGAVTSTVQITVGGTATVVRAGDLNGNSTYDLMVLDFVTPRLVALLDPGTATPSTAMATSPGGAALLTIGYFDYDGSVDAVVADSSTATVYPGPSTTLTALPAVPLTSPPADMIGVNISGDERRELLVSYPSIDAIGIFPGDPSARFSSERLLELEPGTTPTSVTFGDFDGDGRTELAVAEPGAARIEILFEACFAD